MMWVPTHNSNASPTWLVVAADDEGWATTELSSAGLHLSQTISSPGSAFGVAFSISFVTNALQADNGARAMHVRHTHPYASTWAKMATDLYIHDRCRTCGSIHIVNV